MPRKVLTVVGARPQFVKAAVVSRALANRSELDEVMVHTGQHFHDNMSAIFFEELAIRPPKHNLGIGGGTHASNTGRAMEALEAVIEAEAPAVVVVYGDTDSTLAGALAASKLCVPVAHVEAGLRSFNRRMPEEINRVVTDHVSTILFAPSQTAVSNLAQEGISGTPVRMVGDVMYEAVKIFGVTAAARSTVLERLKLRRREYLLVTLHRKENTDDRARLGRILAGLATSAVPVILPIHPRTRKRIVEFGLEVDSCIRIIEPIGYLDMMMLQRNAKLIATDSGGVQKEAYFHGVPCLTLRDETEWIELVESGANRLVSADETAIAAALHQSDCFRLVPKLYGNGTAARDIAAALTELS